MTGWSAMDANKPVDQVVLFAGDRSSGSAPAPRKRHDVAGLRRHRPESGYTVPASSPEEVSESDLRVFGVSGDTASELKRIDGG